MEVTIQDRLSKFVTFCSIPQNNVSCFLMVFYNFLQLEIITSVLASLEADLFVYEERYL